MMKNKLARALLGGVLTLTTNLMAQKTSPLPVPPDTPQSGQGTPLVMTDIRTVQACTLDGAAISANLGIYIDQKSLTASAKAGKLKNLPASLETLQDVWRDAVLKITQAQIDAKDSTAIEKSISGDVEAWLTSLKTASGVDLGIIPLDSIVLKSNSGSCVGKPLPPLSHI